MTRATQDEFAPAPNSRSGAFGGSPVGSWDRVARPVNANSHFATLDSSRAKIKMSRIKNHEWCTACLAESAMRPQPATIEVRMDSGARFLFCEEHFKSYCRMVTDEEWQGAVVH